MILQNDVSFEVPLPLRPASLWSEGSCFTVKFTLTSLIGCLLCELKVWFKNPQHVWHELNRVMCLSVCFSLSSVRRASAPFAYAIIQRPPFLHFAAQMPTFFIWPWSFCSNRPLIYSDTVKQGCHRSKCTRIDFDFKSQISAKKNKWAPEFCSKTKSWICMVLIAFCVACLQPANQTKHQMWSCCLVYLSIAYDCHNCCTAVHLLCNRFLVTWHALAKWAGRRMSVIIW